MRTYIPSLKQIHDIFTPDEHDIPYPGALTGYIKSSVVIRQFSYPVPVGIIDNVSIAAAWNMSSVMPACKRNTYAVAAIALSLLPSGADGAPVRIWYKQIVSYIVPVLPAEFICIFTHSIQDPVIGCFPDLIS